MYKYLFGPVPSRRLGMSLGVDLVPPKVCSLDCVYCEVGKTTELTLNRRTYIDSAALKAELEDYFANRPSPDYITFSGSGEPTLHVDIGAILQFIKDRQPEVPVAVLTNGTLLSNPAVRKEILPADLVLPSLDGATERTFRRINRPAKGLTAASCIDGLIAFRKEFSGTIWLEIFILPGYNDDEAELRALRDAIVRIAPDTVQLNTLDRPGTVPNLRGATLAELQRVKEFWQLDRVEIIAAAANRKRSQSYRSDTETAILETIARRPCTIEDLTAILGLHANEVNKYLDVLDNEDRIVSVRQPRGIFYKRNG